MFCLLKKCVYVCVCAPVYMNKYRAISYLKLTTVVMKYLLSISCILIVIWVLENKSKAKKQNKTKKNQQSSDKKDNRQIT